MYVYLFSNHLRALKGYLLISNVGLTTFTYDGLLLKFYMSKNLVASDLHV